jgi:hypothetical protein
LQAKKGKEKKGNFGYFGNVHAGQTITMHGDENRNPDYLKKKREAQS